MDKAVWEIPKIVAVGLGTAVMTFMLVIFAAV